MGVLGEGEEEGRRWWEVVAERERVGRERSWMVAGRGRDLPVVVGARDDEESG